MSAEDKVEGKPNRRRKRRGKLEETNMEETSKTVTERKGRATPSRRVGQDTESGNFAINTFRDIREYFAGVQDEMSKVVWPERDELIRLTRLVMIVVILSSLGLGILALGFTELFRFGLDGNEWVFLVFFGVVSLIAVAMQRASARRDRINPYN